MCCRDACGSGSSDGQQQEPPSNLGSLPTELTSVIIGLLAPPTWQDVSQPHGYPDVRPCRWHEPATYAQLLKETEAAQSQKPVEQQMVLRCRLQ
jgi:hypothetical protein